MYFCELNGAGFPPDGLGGRAWIPAFGENDGEKGSDNNRTGFPPAGENDGGEGKDHSRCCVRVFLFPSLPCAFFPFAVILVVSTGIQS